MSLNLLFVALALIFLENGNPTRWVTKNMQLQELSVATVARQWKLAGLTIEAFSTFWRACRFIQKRTIRLAVLTLAAFNVVSSVASAKTAKKTTRSGERSYVVRLALVAK